MLEDLKELLWGWLKNCFELLRITNLLQIYKLKFFMRGDILYKNLSYRIVGVLYDVYNQLGYGYKEKHYERAVGKLLIERSIKFRRQAPYTLFFQSKTIGRYYLDFIIENKIVLELKKGNYFDRRNIGQINGYLKATGLKLGIIANFISSRVQFMRILNIRDD